MDWATVVGDSVLAAGGVVTASLAARANRHAKSAANVGNDNAAQLALVRKQTDGRQHRMIKKAVEEVAREHPQLVSEAIADAVIRTVLEAILTTHAEEPWHPHRRDVDDDGLT